MDEHNSRTIEQKEREILKEEKEILKEVRREEQELRGLNRRVMILAALVVFVIGGGIAGLTYWHVAKGQVYIEKSDIEAPRIDLAPQGTGILNELYAQAGDIVGADTAVARVGNELIKAKVGGEVISVENNIGKLVNRGEAVVSMIDPAELRAVGRLEEDKGLADIRVGERATFTVDAFGSKQYQGVVDEISPTSRDSDVVFNISDKREIKEFNVKVRFDLGVYPELKNGMSAKIWVHKN